VLAAAARWLPRRPEAHATWEALAADPLAGAVPLRLLAALHHLALRGEEPWAAAWPPAASTPASTADDDTLESLVDLAWTTRHEHLARAMASPPQTNEVMRSAALLPGLLHVAAQTRRPLALREIGASAGLNLWPDAFGLRGPGWWRGPADATLVLAPAWSGPPPPDLPLPVADRAGCDVMPVDLTQPGEDLRLASYVWADQAERLQRLHRATALARGQMAASGLRVQAQPAATFVRQQLASPRPGCTTVLMHSVMWQYLERAEQQEIDTLMAAAGSRASAEQPLAWLRFEPPRPDQAMELRCRIWPGGGDELLARCHPHGAQVEWQGAPRLAASAP
jgi:hypothetical protein